MEGRSNRTLHLLEVSVGATWNRGGVLVYYMYTSVAVPSSNNGVTPRIEIDA